MPALVWFRSDLRTDDHEPLRRAAAAGPVLGVYALDPALLARSPLIGAPRAGAHRLRFLLESLGALRDELRALGSDLVVRRGAPGAVVPALAREIGATAVLAHEEPGTDEWADEDAVAAGLDDLGIPLRTSWGSTLVHPDDLPFELEQLPDIFSQFRRIVERQVSFRRPEPAPRLAGVPGCEAGMIPTLADLGVAPIPEDPRCAVVMRGGSTAGRERWEGWAFARRCLGRYKETRNGMLAPDDASRLSPWLALGCLSPRRIADDVRRYEHQHGRNDSTTWYVVELLWRDYFRFVLAAHGDRLFRASGLRGGRVAWRHDAERFAAWCEGRTGQPLVDAGMRELAATGWLSNRARQNVASFLAKELEIDWRWGAEWFEHQLLDYDPGSNWANWAYLAGVGNDPRSDRRFNLERQASEYDPRGDYRRTWLADR